MAQHGYAREYDEGWDRERSDRDWRDRDDRSRMERNRDWDDRGRSRGLMFDDDDNRPSYRDHDEGRGAYRGHEDDRGFFARMGDEARSWFGDDDDRSDRGRGGWDQDRDRSRERSDRGYDRMGIDRGPQRGASAHPDDHYRSWRDRQMQSLDRDYADYCREREQQFHSDFDSWRQNRQQSRGAMGQQQQQGGASEAVMELHEPAAEAGETTGTSSALGTATLGTNNSENSTTGRGRR